MFELAVGAQGFLMLTVVSTEIPVFPVMSSFMTLLKCSNMTLYYADNNPEGYTHTAKKF